MEVVFQTLPCQKFVRDLAYVPDPEKQSLVSRTKRAHDDEYKNNGVELYTKNEITIYTLERRLAGHDAPGDKGLT